MKGVARFLARSAAVAATTTITMVGAFAYDPQYYWPAHAGRGANYQDAWITVGDDAYLYFTVDGGGGDPRPTTAALAGRTGYAVALANGDSPDDVAAAAAAATSTIPDFAGNSVGANLTIVGRGAAAFGPGWDARGIAGLVGMLSSTGGGTGYGEGPMNGSCNAACLQPRAADGVLSFIDVYIGTVPGADQTRYALHRSSSTSDPTADSVVLADFGQIPIARPTNGWVRLWLPQPVLVLAGDILWVTWYGDGVTTTDGLYGVGTAGQISTFIDQPFVISTGAMPTDENDPPVPWVGAVNTPFAFVPMIRLGWQSGPRVADASLHSLIDFLIVGSHVDALANVTILPATDAMLSQTTRVNASIGPVRDAGQRMCVAVHGTDQPRMGCYVGADFTDPEIPVITGATLVRDNGRMTGAANDAWVLVPGVGTPMGTAPVVTPVLIHGGPSGPGSPTTIRYTAFANWSDSSPLDAPSDWIEPAAPGPGVGPEVASLSSVPPLSIDPANPLPAVMPDLGGATARVGNVGGTQQCIYCSGLEYVA